MRGGRNGTTNHHRTGKQASNGRRRLLASRGLLVRLANAAGAVRARLALGHLNESDRPPAIDHHHMDVLPATTVVVTAIRQNVYSIYGPQRRDGPDVRVQGCPIWEVDHGFERFGKPAAVFPESHGPKIY